MEFDLIHRYFKLPFEGLARNCSQSVVAGIGDDCASLRLLPDHLLYMSTDTLVEGVHYFHDDLASHTGWKALACNLSDLAACGASPLGFNLSLSLPAVDESWLSGFSVGLLEAATQFQCPLVGGDTTSAGANAAATISITVLGQAPSGHTGFHRSQAIAGDEVWVSGMPGLARLGLLLEYQLRGQLHRCCNPDELSQVQLVTASAPDLLKDLALQALRKPMPQLELGLALRGVANACVDLSDGLVGDLSHIASSSGLAVQLSAESLKQRWLEYWPGLAEHTDSESLLSTLLAVSLQGGDDFQLCWTAPLGQSAGLAGFADRPSRVGQVSDGRGIWLNRDGLPPRPLTSQSYNHFQEQAS